MERVYCRRLAMWFNLYLLGDISVNINQCIATYDAETGVKATLPPICREKLLSCKYGAVLGISGRVLGPY